MNTIAWIFSAAAMLKSISGPILPTACSIPGVEFLTSLGTVVVVGVGGYLGMMGRMDIADVVAFLMYLSLFYQPLTTLARLGEDVQTAFAGAIRVFDILDAESEVREAPDAVAVPKGKGEIEFDNVSFAYESQGTGAQRGEL